MVVTVILFRYVFPILLPFGFAALIGALVYKPACHISKHTKIPLSVCGVFLGIVIYALIVLAAYYLLDRLFREITELSTLLAADGGGEVGKMFSDISDYMSSITEHLPILRDIRKSSGSEEIWQSIDSAVSGSMMQALSAAAQKLPDVIGNVISNAPTVLLGLCVAVIASFYFCTGSAYGEIRALVAPNTAQKLSSIKARVRDVLTRWAKGYLLIMLMTFAIVFVGLLVLRVKYAFLMALIIAVVDLLPILGTGTILVPWGIFAIIRKDYYLGIGLLILYAAVTLIRQVTEPKIIGKSLGVSPLLTLAVTYAGLRLFGFLGMIAAPGVLTLFISAFGHGAAEAQVQNTAHLK